MKRVYVFPISRNALSKMKLTVPSVGAKRYPDVHCTVATVAGNPVVVVKNRAPERFLELKHRGMYQ